MSDRLVDRLAQLPPGPRLAAALAGVDRSRLNGHDLLLVAQARARQIAHEQAQFLADLAEIGHCPPSGPYAAAARTEEPNEFAAEEIGFALRLTRRGAEYQFGLALQVVALPAVHAALDAGRIDLHKASLICDELALLNDPQAAAALAAQVADDAAQLTGGQLRSRLRRLVLAAEPKRAAERHRRALAERAMACHANPDGTAFLAGRNLPADRAAAAAERVDAIAKAAKCAGDPRSMDQLRADTFLALLNGEQAGAAPIHRRGVVELTVPLATLLGLADVPGELAGFGPVLADTARQIATAQRHTATWRISVRDATGALIHHGPLRRRPSTAHAEHVRARDRTCRAPGCRMPARRCDLDHTTDHAHGGAATPANLGVLCRRHHRLKHSPGWRLRQISPGVFAWHSALGHSYLVPALE